VVVKIQILRWLKSIV